MLPDIPDDTPASPDYAALFAAEPITDQTLISTLTVAQFRQLVNDSVTECLKALAARLAQ